MLDRHLKLLPHYADCHEVHQRWISGNEHYIRLCSEDKAEPTLALNPRGEVTRNPKQGHEWQ